MSNQTELQSDPIEQFLPLARCLFTNPEDPWIRPLARLLEADSRGVGNLPAATVLEGLDPATAPAELLTIDGDQALLPRTAAAWNRVRCAVETALNHDQERFEDQAVRCELNRILPPRQEHNSAGTLVFDNVQQRLAAALLVDAPIGVLTGGPGTGKTTSAAALIALRAALEPGLTAADILVCAPTGKAANRLQQALTNAVEYLNLTAEEQELLQALRPVTIHRGVGWSRTKPEDGGPWRHNHLNPLPQRLVLVDEASMADVELTAALVAALPVNASLLFLGDRDQLDSVQAGGVLAELVQRGAAGKLSPAQQQRLQVCLGADAVEDWRKGMPMPAETIQNPLPGLAVGLTWSFRAKHAPWILELARIIRPGSNGNLDAVNTVFAGAENTQLRRFSSRADFYTHCSGQWLALLERTSAWRPDSPPNTEELQVALDSQQLIVATNYQVERANAQAHQVLLSGRARPTATRQSLGPILHGTPVIIEENCRDLDLANGDIGLALGSGPGTPAQVVCFPGLQAPLPVAGLPRHRRAHAITIHKSQGSEWREVTIDIPDKCEGELLDRRLLYTAITRSSSYLGLYAADAALTNILDKQQ